MPTSTGAGPRALRRMLRVAAACALAPTGTAAAASLAVRHEAPACFVADTFPRVDVSLDGAAPVAKVRVAFRPDASSLWHAVTAEAVDGGFRAVLPRPRLAAQRIHYRFEAVAADAGVATSAEYSANVVADPAACPGPAAASEPSARVMVEVPPGAPAVPPVPPGFDPVGAVSATPHKGSSKKKLGLVAGVVVGVAAVGAGVAAGSDGTGAAVTMPPAPNWQIVSSVPPTPGQVSISQGSMSVTVAVFPPRTLASGTARVSFFANLSQPPCAVVGGPNPPLTLGVRGTFTLNTPFVTASPCGLTVIARIAFLDASGQEIVRSGSADFLDASIMYTFVP